MSTNFQQIGAQTRQSDLYKTPQNRDDAFSSSGEDAYSNPFLYTQDTASISLDFPIKNTDDRAEIYRYLDSYAGSDADREVINDWLAGNEATFDTQELETVHIFLSALTQTEKAQSLDLSPQLLHTLNDCLDCLPDSTSSAQGLSVKEAKAFRSKIRDSMGISTQEQRFRDRQYLVDPDNMALSGITQTLYAEGVLTTDMSVEALAEATLSYVQQTFNYKAEELNDDNPIDHWQSVDETLAKGTGDCEDLALLEASLLSHVLRYKKGFSSEEVADMVSVSAGYLVSASGNETGHSFVKLRIPGKKTVRLLDPTSNRPSSKQGDLNYKEVLELNDRRFTKYQDIDEYFVTAASTSLPTFLVDTSQYGIKEWNPNSVDPDNGTEPGYGERAMGTTPLGNATAYGANHETLIWRFNNEVQILLDIIGKPIDIPRMHNGSLQQEVTPDLLDSEGGPEGYTVTITQEYIDENDNDPALVLGQLRSIEDDEWEVLLATMNDKLQGIHDAEEAIKNNEDADIIQEKQALILTYEQDTPHFYKKITSSYTDLEFFDVDVNDSYKAYSLRGSPAGAKGTPTDIPAAHDIQTVRFKPEPFLKHTLRIKQHINTMTMLFHIMNSNIEHINQSAQEIYDSAFDDDVVREMNKVRSANKKHAVITDQISKFQSKVSAGVDQLIQELFTFVNTTNDVIFSQIDLEIDQWMRTFSNGENATESFMQDFFFGGVAELADSLTNILSLSRNAAKEALNKTKMETLAYNAIAYNEYAKIVVSGKGDASTRKGGIRLWDSTTDTDTLKSETTDSEGNVQAQRALGFGEEFYTFMDADFDGAWDSVNKTQYFSKSFMNRSFTNIGDLDRWENHKDKSSSFYINNLIYKSTVKPFDPNNYWDLFNSARGLTNTVDSRLLELTSPFGRADSESIGGRENPGNSIEPKKDKGNLLESVLNTAVQGMSTAVTRMFEPKEPQQNGDGNGGIFVDYNMEKMSEFRTRTVLFQSKVYLALMVKQSEWDKRVEAAKEISGNKGTSSTDAIAKASMSSLQVELGRLTSAFENLHSNLQAVTSATNELTKNRADYYKNQFESSVRISKNVAILLNGFVADSIGVSIAAPIALSIDPVSIALKLAGYADPEYWSYGLSTVGEGIIEIISSSILNDLEHSVSEYNNVSLMQATGEVADNRSLFMDESEAYEMDSSRFSYGNTLKAKKIAHDAISYDAGRPTVFRTLDNSTNTNQTDSQTFYKNKVTSILMDQRMEYNFVETQTFDDSFNTFELKDTPTDKTSGVSFIANKGNNFLVKNGLLSAFKVQKNVHFQQLIKRHLILLRLVYDAIENEAAAIAGTQKAEGMGKLEGGNFSLTSNAQAAEQATIQDLRAEINSFQAAHTQNLTKEKALFDKDKTVIQDTATLAIAPTAFMATYGAGELINMGFQIGIEEAVSSMDYGWGPWVGNYANYHSAAKRQSNAAKVYALNKAFYPDDVNSVKNNSSHFFGDERTNQFLKNNYTTTDPTTQAVTLHTAEAMYTTYFNESTDDDFKILLTDYKDDALYDDDENPGIEATAKGAFESDVRRYAPWFSLNDLDTDVSRTVLQDGLQQTFTDFEFQQLNYSTIMQAQKDINRYATFRMFMLMIEKSLYTQKQNALRDLVGRSSSAGIIENLMEIVELHNTMQTELLNELVDELSSQADSANTAEQWRIDMLTGGIAKAVGYVVIPAIYTRYSKPFTKFVGKHNARKFIKNAINIKSAVNLLQMMGQMIVGLMQLNGIFKDDQLGKDTITENGDTAAEQDQEHFDERNDTKDLGRSSVKSSRGGRVVMNKATLNKAKTKLKQRFRKMQVKLELVSALQDAVSDAAAEISGGSASKAFKGMSNILNKVSSSEQAVLESAFNAAKQFADAKNKAMETIKKASTGLLTVAVANQAAKVVQSRKKSSEKKAESSTPKQGGSTNKRSERFAYFTQILANFSPIMALVMFELTIAISTGKDNDLSHDQVGSGEDIGGDAEVDDEGVVVDRDGAAVDGEDTSENTIGGGATFGGTAALENAILAGQIGKSNIEEFRTMLEDSKDRASAGSSMFKKIKEKIEKNTRKAVSRLTGREDKIKDMIIAVAKAHTDQRDSGQPTQTPARLSASQTVGLIDSAFGGPLQFAGGKIGGGLQWAGAAIGGGLQRAVGKPGRRLKWAGGKIGEGRRWAGDKIGGGLRSVGDSPGNASHAISYYANKGSHAISYYANKGSQIMGNIRNIAYDFGNAPFTTLNAAGNDLIEKAATKPPYTAGGVGLYIAGGASKGLGLIAKTLFETGRLAAKLTGKLTGKLLWDTPKLALQSTLLTGKLALGLTQFGVNLAVAPLMIGLDALGAGSGLKEASLTAAALNGVSEATSNLRDIAKEGAIALGFNSASKAAVNIYRYGPTIERRKQNQDERVVHNPTLNLTDEQVRQRDAANKLILSAAPANLIEAHAKRFPWSNPLKPDQKKLRQAIKTVKKLDDAIIYGPTIERSKQNQDEKRRGLADSSSATEKAERDDQIDKLIQKGRELSEDKQARELASIQDHRVVNKGATLSHHNEVQFLHQINLKAHNTQREKIGLTLSQYDELNKHKKVMKATIETLEATTGTDIREETIEKLKKIQTDIVEAKTLGDYEKIATDTLKLKDSLLTLTSTSMQQKIEAKEQELKGTDQDTLLKKQTTLTEEIKRFSKDPLSRAKLSVELADVTKKLALVDEISELKEAKRKEEDKHLIFKSLFTSRTNQSLGTLLGTVAGTKYATAVFTQDQVTVEAIAKTGGVNIAGIKESDDPTQQSPALTRFNQEIKKSIETQFMDTYMRKLGKKGRGDRRLGWDDRLEAWVGRTLGLKGDSEVKHLLQDEQRGVKYGNLLYKADQELRKHNRDLASRATDGILTDIGNKRAQISDASRDKKANTVEMTIDLARSINEISNDVSQMMRFENVTIAARYVLDMARGGSKKDQTETGAFLAEMVMHNLEDRDLKSPSTRLSKMKASLLEQAKSEEEKKLVLDVTTKGQFSGGIEKYMASLANDSLSNNSSLLMRRMTKHLKVGHLLSHSKLHRNRALENRDTLIASIASMSIEQLEKQQKEGSGLGDMLQKSAKYRKLTPLINRIDELRSKYNTESLPPEELKLYDLAKDASTKLDQLKLTGVTRTYEQWFNGVTMKDLQTEATYKQFQTTVETIQNSYTTSTAAIEAVPNHAVRFGIIPDRHSNPDFKGKDLQRIIDDRTDSLLIDDLTHSALELADMIETADQDELNAIGAALDTLMVRTPAATTWLFSQIRNAINDEAYANLGKKHLDKKSSLAAISHSLKDTAHANALDAIREDRNDSRVRLNQALTDTLLALESQEESSIQNLSVTDRENLLGLLVNGVAMNTEAARNLVTKIVVEVRKNLQVKENQDAFMADFANRLVVKQKHSRYNGMSINKQALVENFEHHLSKEAIALFETGFVEAPAKMIVDTLSKDPRQAQIIKETFERPQHSQALKANLMIAAATDPLAIIALTSMEDSILAVVSNHDATTALRIHHMKSMLHMYGKTTIETMKGSEARLQKLHTFFTGIQNLIKRYNPGLTEEIALTGIESCNRAIEDIMANPEPDTDTIKQLEATRDLYQLYLSSIDLAGQSEAALRMVALESTDLFGDIDTFMEQHSHHELPSKSAHTALDNMKKGTVTEEGIEALEHFIAVDEQKPTDDKTKLSPEDSHLMKKIIAKAHAEFNPLSETIRTLVIRSQDQTTLLAAVKEEISASIVAFNDMIPKILREHLSSICDALAPETELTIEDLKKNQADIDTHIKDHGFKIPRDLRLELQHLSEGLNSLTHLNADQSNFKATNMTATLRHAAPGQVLDHIKSLNGTTPETPSTLKESFNPPEFIDPVTSADFDRAVTQGIHKLEAGLKLMRAETEAVDKDEAGLKLMRAETEAADKDETEEANKLKSLINPIQPHILSLIDRLGQALNSVPGEANQATIAKLEAMMDSTMIALRARIEKEGTYTTDISANISLAHTQFFLGKETSLDSPLGESLVESARDADTLSGNTQIEAAFNRSTTLSEALQNIGATNMPKFIAKLQESYPADTRKIEEMSQTLDEIHLSETVPNENTLRRLKHTDKPTFLKALLTPPENPGFTESAILKDPKNTEFFETLSRDDNVSAYLYKATSTVSLEAVFDIAYDMSEIKRDNDTPATNMLITSLTNPDPVPLSADRQIHTLRKAATLIMARLESSATSEERDRHNANFQKIQTAISTVQHKEALGMKAAKMRSTTLLTSITENPNSIDGRVDDLSTIGAYISENSYALARQNGVTESAIFKATTPTYPAIDYLRNMIDMMHEVELIYLDADVKEPFLATLHNMEATYATIAIKGSGHDISRKELSSFMTETITNGLQTVLEKYTKAAPAPLYSSLSKLRSHFKSDAEMFIQLSKSDPDFNVCAMTDLTLGTLSTLPIDDILATKTTAAQKAEFLISLYTRLEDKAPLTSPGKEVLDSALKKLQIKEKAHPADETPLTDTVADALKAKFPDWDNPTTPLKSLDELVLDAQTIDEGTTCAQQLERFLNLDNGPHLLDQLLTDVTEGKPIREYAQANLPVIAERMPKLFKLLSENKQFCNDVRDSVQRGMTTPPPITSPSPTQCFIAMMATTPITEPSVVPDITRTDAKELIAIAQQHDFPDAFIAYVKSPTVNGLDIKQVVPQAFVRALSSMDTVTQVNFVTKTGDPRLAAAVVIGMAASQAPLDFLLDRTLFAGVERKDRMSLVQDTFQLILENEDITTAQAIFPPLKDAIKQGNVPDSLAHFLSKKYEDRHQLELIEPPDPAGLEKSTVTASTSMTAEEFSSLVGEPIKIAVLRQLMQDVMSQIEKEGLSGPTAKEYKDRMQSLAENKDSSIEHLYKAISTRLETVTKNENFLDTLTSKTQAEVEAHIKALESDPKEAQIFMHALAGKIKKGSPASLYAPLFKKEGGHQSKSPINRLGQTLRDTPGAEAHDQLKSAVLESLGEAPPSDVKTSLSMMEWVSFNASPKDTQSLVPAMANRLKQSMWKSDILYSATRLTGYDTISTIMSASEPMDVKQMLLEGLFNPRRTPTRKTFDADMRVLSQLSKSIDTLSQKDKESASLIFGELLARTMENNSAFVSQNQHYVRPFLKRFMGKDMIKNEGRATGQFFIRMGETTDKKTDRGFRHHLLTESLAEVLVEKSATGVFYSDKKPLQDSMGKMIKKATRDTTGFGPVLFNLFGDAARLASSGSSNQTLMAGTDISWIYDQIIAAGTKRPQVPTTFDLPHTTFLAADGSLARPPFEGFNSLDIATVTPLSKSKSNRLLVRLEQHHLIDEDGLVLDKYIVPGVPPVDNKNLVKEFKDTAAGLSFNPENNWKTSIGLDLFETKEEKEAASETLKLMDLMSEDGTLDSEKVAQIDVNRFLETFETKAPWTPTADTLNDLGVVLKAMAGKQQKFLGEYGLTTMGEMTALAKALDTRARIQKEDTEILKDKGVTAAPLQQAFYDEAERFYPLERQYGLPKGHILTQLKADGYCLNGYVKLPEDAAIYLGKTALSSAHKKDINDRIRKEVKKDITPAVNALAGMVIASEGRILVPNPEATQSTGHPRNYLSHALNTADNTAVKHGVIEKLLDKAAKGDTRAEKAIDAYAQAEKSECSHFLLDPSVSFLHKQTLLKTLSKYDFRETTVITKKKTARTGRVFLPASGDTIKLGNSMMATHLLEGVFKEADRYDLPPKDRQKAVLGIMNRFPKSYKYIFNSLDQGTPGDTTLTKSSLRALGLDPVKAETAGKKSLALKSKDEENSYALIQTIIQEYGVQETLNGIQAQIDKGSLPENTLKSFLKMAAAEAGEKEISVTEFLSSYDPDSPLLKVGGVPATLYSLMPDIDIEKEENYVRHRPNKPSLGTPVTLYPPNI